MQVNEVPAGVHFYNHRGKSIALLPPGTVAREQAEAVVRLRGEGVTYREISEKSGLSISTLHRMVARILLTEEVEAGKRDREIRAAAREAKQADPFRARAGKATPERRTGIDRRNHGYARAS